LKIQSNPERFSNLNPANASSRGSGPLFTS
jgi:hypothetical protein